MIVLHNGSKPIIDKPTLENYIAKIIGTKRFIPKFDYELVDLPALSIEELGKAPLLRVILELLKRATDGTLYDVRKQILEPLAEIRDDQMPILCFMTIEPRLENCPFCGTACEFTVFSSTYVDSVQPTK